jgi:MFS family permease
VKRLLLDLTPLKVSAPYRRLWVGLGVSNIGQQMTAVAVGLQIWDLTHSSLMVGLAGLFQLVPIVVMGLYGGTLSDAHDRRVIGLVSALGLWVCSFAFLAQSLLSLGSVLVLYLIIAVQSGFFAVGNATRQAIIPRLIPVELLPAANALGMITWGLGFSLGPLLGGLVVAATGHVSSAYAVDVIAFAIVTWAMFLLPKLPPIPVEGEDQPRAGWSAVRDAFVFLRGKINLQMSFYEDIIAMVFGMPRALFPAIAAHWYGGSMRDVALVLGLLSAAPAVGSVIAAVLSGPLGHVRRQGFTRWLPLALAFLALAGAADNVSAIFRATILQAATPDHFRGRLQGVFTAVVAGGPRLGDLEAGVVAAAFGEAFSVISGGLACVAVAVGLAGKHRSFWAYDARNPVP